MAGIREMRGKEIRIQVEESTHAAVRVLADSAKTSMDRWVADLIRAEVSKHLAVARRLTDTISGKDLLRLESTRKAPKLYFIQRGDDNGPIKIGVAMDVERRLVALQTGCAEDLRILLIVEQDDQIREGKIHRRFRKIRQSGEWFSCEPELLEFISSLQQETPVAIGERKGDGK